MPYNGPAIKRADPPAGGEGASLQRWPVTRSGSWYPASGGAGKVSRCKEGMPAPTERSGVGGAFFAPASLPIAIGKLSGLQKM